MIAFYEIRTVIGEPENSIKTNSPLPMASKGLLSFYPFFFAAEDDISLYGFVVDDSPFSSRNGVKSVVIKSRVTIIKTMRWKNCSKLTSAAIPTKRGDFCVLQRCMLDSIGKMQYT